MERKGSDTMKTLEKASSDSSDVPLEENEVADSTTPGPMELKTTITVLDTSTGKNLWQMRTEDISLWGGGLQGCSEHNSRTKLPSMFWTLTTLHSTGYT